MNPTFDSTGLDNISLALMKIGDFDATPLMLSWMLILEEDNRRGILQGLDAFGTPMAPVTYRPVKPGGVKVTKAQRGGKRANVKKGGFQGFGPQSSGLHGNLTPGEYRLLGGPPLAPRGQFSRVVTNYQTDYAKLRPGVWQVTFWWQDVVSTQGVPFLRYHFEGAGRLPRRDLRGIRPMSMGRLAESLRNFAQGLIRQAFRRS